MNHDEVTSTVENIARKVAQEPGMSDAAFVMHVYSRVKAEAPEVIAYLEEVRPGADPYQALKWFIPDDLGYSTS